jgi:hypothetical protein
MTEVEAQLAPLAPHAREWTETVLDEYVLSATGKALVVEGARALDLIEQARNERTALVGKGRYEGSARIDSLFTNDYRCPSRQHNRRRHECGLVPQGRGRGNDRCAALSAQGELGALHRARVREGTTEVAPATHRVEARQRSVQRADQGCGREGRPDGNCTLALLRPTSSQTHSLRTGPDSSSAVHNPLWAGQLGGGSGSSSLSFEKTRLEQVWHHASAMEQPPRTKV